MDSKMSGSEQAFGKLIIKASVNSDIRILPINNEDLTYDELILMMQRVFRDKLPDSNTNDSLSIKYKDSVADLVSIRDTNDLSYAIQETSPLLRLHLYFEPKRALQYYQVDGESLLSIRKMCFDLINTIDNLTIGAQSHSGISEDMSCLGDHLKNMQITPIGNGQLNVQKENFSSYFDPLNEQSAKVAPKPESTTSTPSHSATPAPTEVAPTAGSTPGVASTVAVGAPPTASAAIAASTAGAPVPPASNKVDTTTTSVNSHIYNNPTQMEPQQQSQYVGYGYGYPQQAAPPYGPSYPVYYTSPAVAPYAKPSAGHYMPQLPPSAGSPRPQYPQTAMMYTGSPYRPPSGYAAPPTTTK